MSGPKLALYTRAGCHLCDDMVAALRPYLAASGAQLELLDVDDDPETARRYGTEVPVLLGQSSEICRHRLDPEALQAYLNEQTA